MNFSYSPKTARNTPSALRSSFGFLPFALAIAAIWSASLAECFALELREVVGGLDQPIDISIPDDATDRIFIVEKLGQVKIWSGGTISGRPFLDLRSAVSTSGERGLLSIAFHPDFRANRRFFVAFNDTVGDLVVARYHASTLDRNISAPDSQKVLLKIPQPDPNLNSASLRFGPDGHLYIGIADGGGNGDPRRSAQNLGSLAGKILRIDIDGEDSEGLAYGLPADNPFIARAGARKEIWAYGFRNPWRYSFDFTTAQMFVADSGKDAAEEINLVEPGKNYGWSWMEGSKCIVEGCNRGGLRLPIADYPRTEGSRAAGGIVYRGKAITGLNGKYVFADFASGKFFTLSYQRAGFWKRELLKKSELQPCALAEDRDGEILIVDFRGAIFKLVP